MAVVIDDVDRAGVYARSSQGRRVQPAATNRHSHISTRRWCISGLAVKQDAYDRSRDFTDWDKVEILWTPERRRKVDEASRELYSRFQAHVRLESGALLDKLKAGIQDLLRGIGTGLEHHQEIRRTYPEPWDYNTSYEFL